MFLGHSVVTLYIKNVTGALWSEEEGGEREW